MKILHILSQYPDSTGSGIYLQAILREAQKKQHDSSLIAAMNIGRSPDPITAVPGSVSLVSFGTPPLDFALPGMSDVMPYSSSRFRDLSKEQLERYEKAFLEEIDRLITHFGPDIIHSHHLWLLSSITKLNFPKIPMLTSCHGSDLRQLQLCPHLRDRVVQGCRNIDTILALTAAQKDEIRALYNIPAHRIDIVGAGFDDTLFYWSEKDEPPPVHITYCGKLSRAKGVPWLLEAIKKSNMEHYQFHLIGSGQGAEKDECVTLARDLGDKLTLHGALRQDALAAHLRKSHIFILPSLYEGLPLVALEALACGCKVITTELPGCLEIRSQMDPELINMVRLPRLHSLDTPHIQDESAFIDAICRELEKAYEAIMLRSSEKKNITEKNIEPFTWKMVFSRIDKCYTQLVS